MVCQCITFHNRRHRRNCRLEQICTIGTIWLHQPARLHQPRHNQGQRFMNLLHHHPRFDESNDHQKGAAGLHPSPTSARSLCHIRGRPSQRDTFTTTMVHCGGRSPSLNIPRHLGRHGVEVLPTSAPRKIHPWWQAGSCGMPVTRQRKLSGRYHAPTKSACAVARTSGSCITKNRIGSRGSCAC